MAHKLRTPINAKMIIDQFPQLFKSHEGNLQKFVQAISDPDEAHPDHLCFAHTPQSIISLNGKSPGIVVLPLKFMGQKMEFSAEAILYSPLSDWALAEILHSFVRQTPLQPRKSQGIHASAYIHPSAEIGNGVDIGPFAVIGEGVTIGDGSSVGPHAVIESHASIGENVVVHPHVYIGPDCILSDRVEIQSFTTIGKEGFGYAHNQLGHHRRIPHLGKVILGNDVHIGASCTLDRGTLGNTIIGEGTRIDNQCHIAHNCVIGKHCLITARFTMAGSSEIGDHFVCGGLTTVTGHVKVGHNVRVAALSVISKNLAEAGEYGGYPLQTLKEFLKTKASSTSVPELRKRVNQLWEQAFSKNSEKL